jgi:hypothetical protein
MNEANHIGPKSLGTDLELHANRFLFSNLTPKMSMRVMEMQMILMMDKVMSGSLVLTI